MDDDIDIEEHDVMDNPRIKSIFPDLSCVKMEIPDEEEIEEEQYGIDPEDQQELEESQEMLYQYEYSFETATDNINDEAQADNEPDADEGENTYFYNNEIILGSKPPIDPNVLYEEALNSNPIVYLENWENRLKTSPCFCNTCEILFPTVNALDAHKMISHSYLVAMETPQKNTARKSTVTSKFCNHCSKTFADDTSLIKHLYELLPLNNFAVKEENNDLEVQKPKLAAKTTPWPKKIKSTSLVLGSKKIVEPKKIKLEPKESIEIKVEKKLKPKFERLTKDGKFFAASSLVPKSSLFQCNTCQIGFISCFSATQHSKYCENSSCLPFVKCGTCKRKIRKKDAKIHELQHNYNDKLKIFTINKSIYERVLCKCPKCLSCFDELGFWAHYQKCKKTEKKSTHCNICDINIAATRYQSHSSKHTAKKLSKKDFIVVEFYDQNNLQLVDEDILSSTRKQRIMQLKAKRRVTYLTEQNENDITLYYCQFCGCCQYKLNFKGHTDGACKQIKSKKYCEKCGLCFTPKSINSHLTLHEKFSFSLKDIKLVCLTSGKVIEPPVADLYKCKKCTKHFLYKKTLRRHNCKTEKYITCKICTKKLNLQAYKIHKLFHSVDKLIPELLKKYNSINSMWNIMYMCVSCELVTMTYDSAVMHCQGHLNYIISDLDKQCVVCDLKIAEKEFTLHEKLHSNNQSIERGSFKILKYNYEDLFKKEWLLVFKDLPKQQRQEILAKSIYRHTKSVKMQMEISAPTDDTKYICINCNTFIDGTSINQHLKSKCLRNNKYICNVCNEVFPSLKIFLTHVGSHEKIPFNIVSFNNECDKEFNSHLSLIASKSKSENKPVLQKKPDVPLSKLREILLSDSAKKYKLYKCAKCGTCVSLKSSIRRHSKRCVSHSERKFCEICEQYFASKKFPMHMDAHKKKPYITKNSFHIVFFNGDEKTAKINLAKQAKVTPKKTVVKVNSPKEAKSSPKEAKSTPKKDVNVKIYECECGLHFTSIKTIEKHIEECSSDLVVSKETCSKCNLVFPTQVLVNHLINHHHKATKIVVEKIIKSELFKCVSCLSHFTDVSNFNAHIQNCDIKNAVYCKNCKLKFGKNSISQHLCNSEGVTCVNTITAVKKVVHESTVYKCELCDICYLQRNSFRYHYFEVNHKLNKPPTPCDVCGIKLTNCSYLKHKKIHDFKNEDYRIKVLDIINDRCVFLTGNNKVNTTGSNDSQRSSPRKRKLDDSEENSALDKKVKKNFDNTVTRSVERITRASILDKPSTSKEIQDYDDNPTEFIVPDEISQYHLNTDSDNDTSVILSDRNDSPQTKNTGLSDKIKSRILVRGYDKTLYKCIYCEQHYMKDRSFDYHAKNHKLNEELHKCDICELFFSKTTLPRHKYVHHDKMRLKRDDFIILTETASSTESEILERIKKLKKEKSAKEILDTSNNTTGLNDTDSANNTQIPSEVNNSDTCNTKSDITDNVSDIHKICYYKCFDCNVCFVDQQMCFEHTLKHEILDPKSYIQCKICDFQFLIDSLKEHMNLHHNSDFMIENLTIHEYKALDVGLDPKIDVYQAVDKLQSRLVSTTTDVGVV